MLVLETHDLCKKYKEQWAVDHVAMHIEAGDIYGFVGENGAGKTTVIRLITGIAWPTEGSYKLFGTDYRDKAVSVLRKKMRGIVETVSLNLSLTARENLAYQGMLLGIKLGNDEIDALLSRVGLHPNEIALKKVRSFSLGMKQRLGMAATLIGDPEFIILDEPMNGLDPTGFIEVRDLILKLNSEGITFLISSHILSELEKVCTKIGFLSHGKLLKELTVEELRDQSKTKIVIESDEAEEIERTLVRALSASNIVTEGRICTIYDPVDLNDVIRVLAQNELKVTNISRQEDTIESYYMKLIGGGLA